MRGKRPNIERAKDTKKAVGLIWQNLLPFKFKIIIIFIFVILTGFFSLISPYILSIAIDRYIETPDLTGLTKISIFLFFIFIFRSLFSFFQSFEMVKVSQTILKNMRTTLFSHIQNLTFRVIEKMKKGDILSRISNDIENINNFLTSGFSELASNIVFIIGTVFIMMLLNWKLALVSLSIIPIIVLVTSVMTRWTRKAYRKNQKVVGELSGFLEENLTGIRTIKSFGREEYIVSQFNLINNRARKIEFKAELASLILPPTLQSLSGIGIGLVVLLGSILVLKGHASIGALAGIIIYTRRFFHPFRALAALYNQLQSALAGIERIREIQIHKVESDPETAEEISNVQGNISIEDVHFSYDNSNEVLKKINIDIKAGHTLALVGPTGAGKTTIVKLISRFYEPDSGRIKIDEKDFSNLKKKSYRKNISVVLQEPFIFSRSIRDNLKYGNHNSTDEEMFAASKIANAHHFIKNLPEGYDTIISEEATNISSGERQLISIARALLADRPIIILDEATSNVDTRTEKSIQDALSKLSKNKTSIVIAHRLSTIKNADLIVVIENGKIVEHGKHHDLMKKKGSYFNMYTSNENY